MRVGIRRWLLNQLNAKNTLDAVVVAVELAVSDKGDKKVAKELRRMADSLERTGNIRGWTFPKSA
jgi:hypothetical protein